MSQEEWHRETSPFNNLLQITLSLKNFILYSPSEELSPKTKTKIHVFLPTVFFTQNKTKKQRANLCLTGVIKWHQPNFHSLLQGKSLKLISVVLLRMKQHPTILIPLPKWVPFNECSPRSRELVSVLQVIGSLLEGDAARRGLKATGKAESRLDGFSRWFLRRGDLFITGCVFGVKLVGMLLKMVLSNNHGWWL